MGGVGVGRDAQGGVRVDACVAASETPADGGGGSNNTNGWKPFAPAIHAHVTRWGSDPFARGVYSFVAVGASARDYDEMTRPEGPSSPAAQRRVVFAGEHCCKEHPDTVGGAMLSGWRAARHAMRAMRGEGRRTTRRSSS